MTINPYKKPFIVIEGIDGCGKSTLLDYIRQWDKLHELNSVFTEEPTERFLPGQKIHRLLKNGLCEEGGRRVSPDEFQGLYILDRLEHRAEEAVFLQSRPVISSRDFPSTVCYGAAGGVFPQWVMAEHERILGELFFAPDLVIILDLPAEEAMKRIGGSGKTPDYFEKKLDFLTKVRENYLNFPETIRKAYPGVGLDIRVISASGSPEEVYRNAVLRIAEIFRDKPYKK